MLFDGTSSLAPLSALFVVYSVQEYWFLYVSLVWLSSESVAHRVSASRRAVPEVFPYSSVKHIRSLCRILLSFRRVAQQPTGSFLK